MSTQPPEQPFVARGSAILPISARKSAPRSEALCGSPQLTLTLGRDRHSSGISVWLQTPTGSVWPAIRLLMAERWNDVLPGELGCVEIAIQALQEVKKKLESGVSLEGGEQIT